MNIKVMQGQQLATDWLKLAKTLQQGSAQKWNSDTIEIFVKTALNRTIYYCLIR